MNSHTSSFLNFSRWFAAFVVVLDHSRHFIFNDLSEVEHPTILIKLFYLLTGLGHEGVMVFFVISGFLVGGLTLDRWRTKGINFRSYTVARVSRIYTVLIPTLIVGYFLDFTGLHAFNASELYTNAMKYHIDVLYRNFSEALDLKTIIGNGLLLQNILVEPLGTNSPLWSLASECWYYALFALIATALLGKGGTRYVCAVVAIALIYFLPQKLVWWGGIWLLGLVTYFWSASRLWRPHPLLGFGVLLIGVLGSRVSLNMVHNSAHAETMVVALIRDAMVGVAYAVALVSMSRLSLRLPTSWLGLSRLNDRLADFSYSTYCFHFPLLVFLVAAGVQTLGLPFHVQPTGSSLLYWFVLVVMMYPFCYALSLLTERNTPKVRAKLSSLTEFDLRRKILAANDIS